MWLVYCLRRLRLVYRTQWNANDVTGDTEVANCSAMHCHAG